MTYINTYINLHKVPNQQLTLKKKKKKRKAPESGEDIAKMKKIPVNNIHSEKVINKRILNFRFVLFLVFTFNTLGFFF